MRKQTINASIKNAVEIAEGTSAYTDHIKRIKKILTQGMAVIAGTSAASANADIVYFENPEFGEEGHYNWHWDYAESASWLDITQGPENQSNVLGPNSVGQLSYSTFYETNLTDGGAEVGVLGNNDLFTKAFTIGEMLDSSASWSSFGMHTYHAYYISSDFDEGVRAYIGVRTLSGNYGWIAVERGTDGFRNEMGLTAFAWAFETEPGVPIRAGEIPAPGTLALLAFGAVMREKRKRN